MRLGDATHARKAFDATLKLKPLAFSLHGRALAGKRLNDLADAEQDLAAERQSQPSIDDEDVRIAGLDITDAVPPPPSAGS